MLGKFVNLVDEQFGGLTDDKKKKRSEKQSIGESEERVKSYLSRIKSLKDIHGGNIETRSEAVSLETLHTPTPQHRHVYFAGLPLSQSKEFLALKREQRLQQQEKEKLENQLEQLNHHVSELQESFNVNYTRFQLAVTKAMQIGMACGIMCNVFQHVRHRQQRIALAKMSTRISKRRMYRLATPIVVNRIATTIDKLENRQVYHALQVLKHCRKSTKTKPSPATTKQGTDMDNIKETLLIRLEQLVNQEMKLLNIPQGN
ncbi:hypothetical protein BdWA1_002922 [Babesia duncani]|uniref:Uncharacterized protein n=1 Tax=Babesia duncani TaxID=323732 RepID=A0AAD9UMT4_9APIC|nr:hypothetical protein BdWA1_002922 [Babesia duncani]